LASLQPHTEHRPFPSGQATVLSGGSGTGNTGI
jgi:hypothetical protein